MMFADVKFGRSTLGDNRLRMVQAVNTISGIIGRSEAQQETPVRTSYFILPR